LLLLTVLCRPAGARGAGGPPVVDPDGVLTAAEQEFLSNAVVDVRRRTPFEATVVIVRRADGRSSRELAEELATTAAGDGEAEVALVLTVRPPAAAVVSVTGRVDNLGYGDAVAASQRAARRALDREGLPQAGLAFTAALVDAEPDAAETPGWGPILGVIGAIVLVALALRAWFAFRRTRRVPKEARSIAEVNGDEGLVRGQIVSEQWIKIGASPELVWFERTDSQYRRRFQRWEDGTGRGWYEEAGGDWDSQRSEDGVTFAISDGTGYAWVDPLRATAEGPRVDSSGWFSGDHQHTTYGIPWGSEVTIGGPCTRDAEGSLVFAPAGGGGVLVSHRKPGKARRVFRGRFVRAVVHLGVWGVIYVLIMGAVSGS
jgi:hypothetical protein